MRGLEQIVLAFKQPIVSAHIVHVKTHKEHGEAISPEGENEFGSTWLLNGVYTTSID